MVGWFGLWYFFLSVAATIEVTILLCFFIRSLYGYLAKNFIIKVFAGVLHTDAITFHHRFSIIDTSLFGRLCLTIDHVGHISDLLVSSSGKFLIQLEDKQRLDNINHVISGFLFKIIFFNQI